MPTRKVKLAAAGGSAVVIAGLIALAVTPFVSAATAQPEATNEPAAIVESAAPAPVATTPPPVTPAATASAAATPAAPTCSGYGRFSISAVDGEPFTVTMEGRPIDHGPRGGANGTVELDADGTLTAYTAASGDSHWGIQERFCFSLILHNNMIRYDDLHPGDRLSLLPNPDYVEFQ